MMPRQGEDPQAHGHDAYPRPTRNAYTDPLTYPGTWPDGSGLLVDGRFDAVEPGELDTHLGALTVPLLAERLPVLAVGSNASPVQLRAKFARQGRASQDPLVIPMTLVRVDGLVAGISAHVSRPGFVPATPVAAAGVMASLFVVWLTPPQLEVVDATEPSYDRVPLGPEYIVGGAGLGRGERRIQMYASRHGYLVDTTQRPRRLGTQRDLIRDLLGESAMLRRLAGSTPDHWLVTMKDPATRRRARDIWAEEGRVGATM
jgi:hypothetical protein